MLTIAFIVYAFHLIWEQFCYDHNINWTNDDYE